MQKKYFIWAMGALFIFLTLGACQNDRNVKPRDPLDEMHMLIDRGEHTEAIQEIQVLMAHDERPSVKVALASAYAARAGIRVQEYWGFVIGFAPLSLTPGAFPKNPNLEKIQKFAHQLRGKQSEREVKALGGVLQGVSVWEQYQERLEAIPTVSGAALQDMRKAVEVLSLVRTPGGRLYRAILNLILFKSYLLHSQGFWLDFGNVIEKILNDEIEVLCRFQVERMLEWLDPLSYHLIEALNDLIVAYPEDRKHTESAMNVLRATYQMTRDAVEDLREKRLCQ